MLRLPTKCRPFKRDLRLIGIGLIFIVGILVIANNCSLFQVAITRFVKKTDIIFYEREDYLFGYNALYYHENWTPLTNIQDLIKQRNMILIPENSRDEKSDVILSSYMNSGSRFTGRLLGYTKDVFYFYEPLWKFTLWDYFKPPDMFCSSTVGSCRKVTTQDVNQFRADHFSDKTEPILHNITKSTSLVELFLHVVSSAYTCNFVPLKNVVQERVQDHPSYGGPSWEVYRTCIMNFKPKSFCLRQLEQVCRNRTNRVIKVLRTSVSTFKPLLETNPRLKIVHLVRDPRAIINSRAFSRGYPIYGYRPNNSLETNLCTKMADDFKEVVNLMKLFPNRVKIIYYEDLMGNLHVRLKSLYSFLNMKYNKTEVDNLAKVQVNLAPPEKGIDFAKDRQESNSFWWRKYMQDMDLTRVDSACRRVYDMYGYQMMSAKQLKDLDQPSLQIPDQFRM